MIWDESDKSLVAAGADLLLADLCHGAAFFSTQWANDGARRLKFGYAREAITCPPPPLHDVTLVIKLIWRGWLASIDPEVRSVAITDAGRDFLKRLQNAYPG